MTNERAMQLLNAVVDHVSAAEFSKEAIKRLMDIGFTSDELVDDFSWSLTDVRGVENEILIPDPTITIEEMQKYGYDWEDMLPLREEVALRIFESEIVPIFYLYTDGSEGEVDDDECLKEHAERGGIFGIEKDDWLLFVEKTIDEDE